MRMTQSGNMAEAEACRPALCTPVADSRPEKRQIPHPKVPRGAFRSRPSEVPPPGGAPPPATCVGATLSLQHGNGSGGACSVSTQEASQGGKEAPRPPQPSGHPAATQRLRASALRQQVLRPACLGPCGLCLSPLRCRCSFCHKRKRFCCLYR